MLAVTASSSLAVSIFRPILRMGRTRRKVIIFYGHTLNGNLKALFDYLNTLDKYEVYFLVLDNEYYSKLKGGASRTDRIISALSPRDMLTVGRADAFITSHGLHMFVILRWLTNIKFFDVWHGIPYKGFDEEDMKHLHGYDQTWVSSPELKKIYIDKYGFSSSIVKVTGYGRVDQLVNSTLDRSRLFRKYKIKPAKRYVLIAPTWAQDEKGRSILPFGVSEAEFFGELDDIARKNQAVIIFRSHLNSSENLEGINNLKNIQFMPYAKYENAEEFLYLLDILVTDWSSIAFDFLPLHRPTIFLDVEAPFKKGFTLGPEHRFGSVVSGFTNLKEAIDKYLKNPASYMSKYGKRVAETEKIAYSNTLDGKSVIRYEQELNKELSK